MSPAFDLHTKFSGYVTTLSSITGKTASEIERSLGFGHGSLNAGFVVYALVDTVGVGDFEWKDRTTYSDGWHFDPSIGEYVQRQDELRAQFGKRNNYDERATDAQLGALMQAQVTRLNVRSGPDRIIKVLAKAKITSFPDSPHRNVPQWKLTVNKSFARVADVSSAGKFAL